MNSTNPLPTKNPANQVKDASKPSITILFSEAPRENISVEGSAPRQWNAGNSLMGVGGGGGKNETEYIYNASKNLVIQRRHNRKLNNVFADSSVGILSMDEIKWTYYWALNKDGLIKP